MSESDPWITHETRVLYDNPWIRVSESQVTHPDGCSGIYGKVHMKKVATGVVPVDEEGYTWLVGQWRYCLKAYSWEIPEGGADPGEDPLTAVKRELLEETGCTAGSWKLLQMLHTSNSVTDEVAYIYLAQEVVKVSAPKPDSSEKLTVKRIPLVDAVAMVQKGEITDAVSVAGLLRAASEITTTL